MANPMSELAHLLSGIQEQLRALDASTRLSHASIEDGRTLVVKDIEGRDVLSIGQQWDGSYVAQTLIGPTPPQPTQPLLSDLPGGIRARWDGYFMDSASTPTDFTRIEVHVSDDPDFVPDTADTLVGSIESPRGGNKVITNLPGGTYYVYFLARSASGAVGPKSSVSIIEITDDVLRSDHESVVEALNSTIVIANGKTSNYYSPSEPVEPDHGFTVGDTWFDSSVVLLIKPGAYL